MLFSKVSRQSSVDLSMSGSKVCMPISLVPRLLWEGEERAWYTPFVHALNHPVFPGIGIFRPLLCYDDVTSRRVNVDQASNEVKGQQPLAVLVFYFFRARDLSRDCYSEA